MSKNALPSEPVTPFPGHVELAGAALTFLSRVDLNAKEIEAFRAVQGMLHSITTGATVMFPAADLTVAQRKKYTEVVNAEIARREQMAGEE